MSFATLEALFPLIELFIRFTCLSEKFFSLAKPNNVNRDKSRGSIDGEFLAEITLEVFFIVLLSFDFGFSTSWADQST